MRRVTLLAAAALGLLFPLGLALAVYVASAASLDEPAGVRVGTEPLASATVTVVRTQTASTTEGTTTERDDDVSGKCDDPENRSDPDCVGATATDEDDDDSGRGRGRGGDSDDSSGSGSDSSGKGSGGDD
jgi:uncharacterized membrane protein YgcG